MDYKEAVETYKKDPKYFVNYKAKMLSGFIESEEKMASIRKDMVSLKAQVELGVKRFKELDVELSGWAGKAVAYKEVLESVFGEDNDAVDEPCSVPDDCEPG